jgi:hypothetical protein
VFEIPKVTLQTAQDIAIGLGGFTVLDDFQIASDSISSNLAIHMLEEFFDIEDVAVRCVLTQILVNTTEIMELSKFRVQRGF